MAKIKKEEDYVKALQERVAVNLIDDLKVVPLNRIKNGVDDEFVSFRELTRMIPNTESWKNVKKELETKPRRKK